MFDIYKEIVTQTQKGYLATLSGDQPRVRTMSFNFRPDGKLWSSTYKISGKMKEFLEHSKVEICFDHPLDYRQLRVEGIIDTTGGKEKKKQMLADHPPARNHFRDEFDAKLVHIEIVPTRVRWKSRGFAEYTEIDVNSFPKE